jgi:N-acyl-D-amino-acid deacylase
MKAPFLLTLLLWLGPLSTWNCFSAGPTFDVLIRAGRVVDGTGTAAVIADVGITAGKIVAVGDLKNSAGQLEIDAADQVVCPGFIDLHTHADRGIRQFSDAENYIRQGVTTLVCGNCGSSPTDVAAFFAELREKGTGPNVALLIGHGSVRERVIGRLNIPPTEEQLVEMRRLVRQAMGDGSIGLSTSLRYGPGAYASTNEIIALAKEIKPFGGFYATHMRDEGTRILEALDEVFEIGRAADVPVHVSHHKVSSASVFGLTRLTLASIDKARKEGLDVTLDQYPYGAGSGGVSLYVPQASLSGGLGEFRKRIADAKQRTDIVAGVEELLIRKIYESGQRPTEPEHTAIALARIQIAGAPHEPKLEGKNLTEILQSRNQSVTLRNGADLLVELVAHGVRGINHTLDARPGGDVDSVMQHPLTCIASDGSVFEFGSGHPHPRSYGCYPRVLGHYVRERKVLQLQQAIHKMTQLPAQRLGWRDRGVLKPGQWADIVVFDPKSVSDIATFLAPHQQSVGISHVLVAGQFVLKSEEMTGALPGRPVGLGERLDSELPEINHSFKIEFTPSRIHLTKQYAKEHYSKYYEKAFGSPEMPGLEFDPKVIVVHYTAGTTLQGAFRTFAPETLGGRPYLNRAGAVNVGVQFVVDRDGTIYQITPDNYFGRHCIGLNHCAIGFENVGRGDIPESALMGELQDDNRLTLAQLEANIKLIRYLKQKYSGIEILIGHSEYRQLEDPSHPGFKFFHENDPSYRTVKSDPGPRFMKALRTELFDLLRPGTEGQVFRDSGS